MHKQLTAKIQKINPKLPEETNNISKAIVIEPDDDTMLEKKGTLYAVFDISSKKKSDNLLVSKIVNDVLHDSYFQAESASPIQSIEKAVLKLRDNIVELTKSGDMPDPDMNFNIATAVLWGNTLYLVQYGSTAVFLMREGTTKPIESATEGSFAVASGVIKDNDVVVLATENFSEKYPPEKLVGLTGIGLEELDELEASLILKFNIKKEFSEDEALDFGYKSEKLETAPKPETEAPKKARKPVAISRPSVNLKNKPRWLFGALALFAVLIVFAIAVRMFGANNDGASEAEESNTLAMMDVNTEAAEKTAENLIDPEQDKANKVYRVEPSVFYDVKMADSNVSPSDIEVIDEVIVVSDGTAGTLYFSDINSPKFAVVPGQTYAGVRDLVKYGEMLGFFDNEGFKVYDPINQEVTASYAASDLGPSTTYLEFVYALSSGKLTKYTKEGTALDGTLWTESLVASDILDMGIDQSIYAITTDSEMVKFTTGELDDFDVVGLDKAMSNPKKIVVDVDLEYIYVVDAGNNRILVLNKQGALMKQLKLKNEADWGDLRSIAINYNETKAFVVNGTKVYEVDLTTVPAETAEQAPEDADE